MVREVICAIASRYATLTRATVFRSLPCRVAGRREPDAEAIANIKIAIEEYLSVLEEQFHDADVKEVEVTV